MPIDDVTEEELEAARRESKKPIDITDGIATVPDGPGWGADINLEALSKYPPTDFVQIQDEPYLDF